jgi:site-specific DNA-adenine methylase
LSHPNRTLNTPFSNKGSVRHFSTSTKSLSLKPKEPNNSTECSKDVIEFLKKNNLEPVYVYEKLRDKTVQSKVLNDTRNLAGVYLILNKFNLSCYVGSASTGKFNSRFRRHLFNFQGSKIVKAAVKKYKIDNFAFIILEVFAEEVNKENNKQLLDMEDYYLKSLLPDYNIVTEAGNTFGYKHSEITRIKMSENYSPERRL